MQNLLWLWKSQRERWQKVKTKIYHNNTNMELAIEIIKREIAQRELANKDNNLQKDEITKEIKSLIRY